MEFAVVKFPEENNVVAVVPLTWVRRNHEGEFCYYPPDSTKDVTSLVKQQALPAIHWKMFSISIMHEYATFKEARSKLKKAEDTSNLSSGEEEAPKKRKPRRPGFLLPGEENSTDDEEDLAETQPEIKKKPVHPYPSFNSMFTSPSQSSLANCSPESVNTPSRRSQLFSPLQQENATLRKSVCNCDRYGVVLGQLQATIADLSQEMRGLHEKVDTIIQNCKTSKNSSQDTEDNLNFIGALPLMEEAALESFEQKLEAVQFQNLLLKVLMSVGGKDKKTMTYNCLRRCLGYEVADKYSYSGVAAKDKEKTKKKSFKSTQLCKVIQAAVKKIHPSATDDEVKTSMCHWLQQAKTRIPKKVVPADDAGI